MRQTCQDSRHKHWSLIQNTFSSGTFASVNCLVDLFASHSNQLWIACAWVTFLYIVLDSVILDWVTLFKFIYDCSTFDCVTFGIFVNLSISTSKARCTKRILHAALRRSLSGAASLCPWKDPQGRAQVLTNIASGNADQTRVVVEMGNGC